MRRVIVFSLLVTFGCASTYTARPVTIPESRRPEVQALPQHPKEQDLSEFPGGEDEVEAISEGAKAPFDGIVSSERRAARDGAYRSSYEELRAGYEADRKVWKVQRELYETQLDQADRKIQDMQPGWWDEHKDEIYFGLGLLVGVGGVYVGSQLGGK